MLSPKISIIVPVYKVENELKDVWTVYLIRH